MQKEDISSYFMSLQDSICQSLEKMDGKGTFIEDPWQRPGGGGGRSRVLNEGTVIEKGGVNYSAVFGETPEKILTALKLEKAEFYATGVSIVLHPGNPHVPIIHMNVRYFEMSNGVWWFGGGIDLTPHYIINEDARYFHSELKRVCNKHSPDYYSQFKEWADKYFYIKHRKESRGIGGIFFDRLGAKEGSKEEIFNFVKDVGELFAPTYITLAEKHRNDSFSESEKKWQYLRRGRYVEFNLVYDKGTKFGLDTDGRTESILMSLPKNAGWEYNFIPQKGSKEEKTLDILSKVTNWVDID